MERSVTWSFEKRQGQKLARIVIHPDSATRYDKRAHHEKPDGVAKIIKHGEIYRFEKPREVRILPKRREIT